jgi:hypothetical protein
MPLLTTACSLQVRCNADAAPMMDSPDAMHQFLRMLCAPLSTRWLSRALGAEAPC